MECGKVWLVGAGPSDIGLLTLKGKAVIEQAEVVVYDQLVGPAIMQCIPADAVAYDAGKKAGNHKMKQEEINRLLLREAKRGKRVVRLKGGDPFLFGRGGEELELLRQEGIPYEVVPGITSALAVPAYQGIPVTHRDYCASVHIITGHRRQGEEETLDFDSLVKLDGTLVFLMGVAALPHICSGLLRAGIRPDMPAAVLERGTTARQRRVIATVSDLSDQVQKAAIAAPAVIVVGEVCRLGEEFEWYSRLPLAGRRFLVTRPQELISKLTGELRERGAEVLELPAIAVEPIAGNEALERALERLEEYQWLVFTSPSGVRIFFEKMLDAGKDIRKLGAAKIAVIGPGTGKELRKHGLLWDFCPSVYTAEHLGRELADFCRPGERILIPRAKSGNPELVVELEKAEGLLIDDIALYETCYRTHPYLAVQDQFIQGEIDYAVFTSASTVKGFRKAIEMERKAPDAGERTDAGFDFSLVKAVCIGAKTQEEARRCGMTAFVAAQPTIAAVVEEIERLCE